VSPEKKSLKSVEVSELNQRKTKRHFRLIYPRRICNYNKVNFLKMVILLSKVFGH